MYTPCRPLRDAIKPTVCCKLHVPQTTDCGAQKRRRIRQTHLSRVQFVSTRCMCHMPPSGALDWCSWAHEAQKEAQVAFRTGPKVDQILPGTSMDGCGRLLQAARETTKHAPENVAYLRGSEPYQAIITLARVKWHDANSEGTKMRQYWMGRTVIEG
jgi:hypothetical protein